MTESTVNETERMVVTRIFDAPRELVWKAWTDPKYVMQWWGPKGFTAPFCEMDFRVGGKISLLHENAGWAGVLECWGIPRDCSAREDRFLHVLFGLEGKQG